MSLAVVGENQKLEVYDDDQVEPYVSCSREEREGGEGGRERGGEGGREGGREGRMEGGREGGKEERRERTPSLTN